MEQIGEKHRFFRKESLRPIDYSSGERPEQIPALGLSDRIYAGVNNGSGTEVMYLLEPGQEALSEVQQLWDSLKAGTIKKVTFYIG